MGLGVASKGLSSQYHAVVSRVLSHLQSETEWIAANEWEKFQHDVA